MASTGAKPWEAGAAAPGSGWPDYSGADLTALHERTVADFAKFREIDPVPEIARGPFLDQAAWPNAQVECFAEQGFDVTITSDGAVSFPQVPPERSKALDLALYTCMVKVPADPRSSEQLPRVRAEMQYAFLVEEAVPCLRAERFDITDPPSALTWLDGYYSGGEAWDPYAELPSEAVHELIELCGEHAPDLWPELP